MLKILIVDDELKIREVVKEYAKVSGYEADEASNGRIALMMVEENDYDCVILDIMMPELDGFIACEKIKKIKDVPIIMLSARQEEDDKLLSFKKGVDDYVTKPFSPKELMARIKVVCERHNKRNGKAYVYKGIKIDVLGRVVYIDNEQVDLTPKEFDLLVYLFERKNVAISRDDLLRQIWRHYGNDVRTVDTHVKMLRNHLGEYRDNIVTIRGMGYKFETES